MFEKKTIAAIAVAALFVGGASAAVLTSFGSLTGDTDVEQSITVNDQEEAEAFEQEFTFNGADVVAGQSAWSSNVLNNNLDEEQTVYFNSEVTNQPDFSDYEGYVDDGTSAYSAEHLLLVNGEAFANTEQVENDVDDDTEANTEYVFASNDEIGVDASYTFEGGHVHAGVWFDVEDGSADDVTISAEVEDGEQDWLYVVYTEGGSDDAYVAGAFDGSDSYGVNDGDTTAVFSTNADIDQIDSRGDFTKVERLDDEDDWENPDWSDVTVHYAVAATGTDGDSNEKSESASVTYTDFTYEVDSSTYDLMRPVNFAENKEVDAPSGDHEFGTVVDFVATAVPGDYEFNLEVNPDNGEA